MIAFLRGQTNFACAKNAPTIFAYANIVGASFQIVNWYSFNNRMHALRAFYCHE